VKESILPDARYFRFKPPPSLGTYYSVIANGLICSTQWRGASQNTVLGEAGYSTYN
jgi:hypothetical protein